MSVDDLISLGNHDDYKEVKTNPNMSKSVLSKMINFQKGYEIDRHSGYA